MSGQSVIFDLKSKFYFIFSSKAREIWDRITLKSSGIAARLNDCAKAVLCLDISCELLHIAFDTKNGIQYSSLRKANYDNNRKMMMKLMDLNKRLKIEDVILKMGLSNVYVEKSAKRIYEAYEQMAGEFTDFDHPMIVTMSVYQACKLEKVVVAKKSFIALSNLKNFQWSIMEKSWDKITVSIKKSDTENSLVCVQQNLSALQVNENNKKFEESEIEDYDVWAKRTISKAKAELELLRRKKFEV